MKSVKFDKFGGPEVLKIQDIEISIKSKTIDDRTLTAQSLLGLCLRARQ